jgi:hypothetical protein
VNNHSYNLHKISAKRRGIPFLLTLKQWLRIWNRSGHFHERGRRASEYVMARYEDKGPYAIGNVKIITQSDNGKEAKPNYGHLGKKHTEETKRILSEQRKGIPTGRKMTEEHKAAMLRGYRKKFPKKKTSKCSCGCGAWANPGKTFIHGHAGRIKLRQIAEERIGKPRKW